MSCQLCANLLAAYEHAVSLYTTSVSEIKTLVGDDFAISDPRGGRQRQACRERHKAWMARDALMAHWRQHQSGLAAKTGPGNDFWLVSQRAEQLRRACHDADDALISHWRQHQSGLAAKGALL
jgi:hypothetical protein